jgi:hypothetical protein
VRLLHSCLIEEKRRIKMNKLQHWYFENNFTVYMTQI